MLSRRQARYRFAWFSSRSCETCAYMNSDGTCQRIPGIVRPWDVCDLYRAAG